MSWLKNTLTSTLGKKLLIALTGLFLITFLLGHLAGNLQLIFIDDGGQAFNEYTKFMTTSPFVKVLSYLTYLSILLHVIYAIVLGLYNKKARPIGYASNNASANSKWASRNMGVLGTIILIFLVIHLKSFWYEMKVGNISIANYGGMEYQDLYTIVIAAFSQWWYVALYVISMVFLGFHLSHGFQSAFQTLGLNHKKYTPAIKKFGLLFSIGISVLFAIIPIIIFLRGLG